MHKKFTLWIDFNGCSEGFEDKFFAYTLGLVKQKDKKELVKYLNQFNKDDEELKSLKSKLLQNEGCFSYGVGINPKSQNSSVFIDFYEKPTIYEEFYLLKNVKKFISFYLKQEDCEVKNLKMISVNMTHEQEKEETEFKYF